MTLQLDHPRARAAYLGTSAALAQALEARAFRFADLEVQAAIAAAAPVMRAVDLSDPDHGPGLAQAMADIVEAVRVSDDREAAQLLADCASPISAADLAQAPERPPVTDQTVVLPTPSPAPPAPRALSRQLAAGTVAAVRDALRALACAAYARRLMLAEYATRNDAVAAREQLAALAAPLLDEGALDGPTFTALAEVTGLASAHLIDRMTTLKPIVRVTTSVPLPACLLAWQLYGDTTRAGELVTRNGVATPAFMPTTLEAVAP